MSVNRRSFLERAALGALAFRVAGCELLLTPRQARARRAELRVLAAEEARLLEAIGEALLPGAREAGIAHFVDSQLAAPPEASLLMLRYFDVPPPYVAFYRPVLAAIDAVARKDHGASFRELDAGQADALVGTLGRQNPEGWRAPPAPLAYIVLRADAVDVVYGTVEGFDRLGVPYMAHIEPPAKW